MLTITECVVVYAFRSFRSNPQTPVKYSRFTVPVCLPSGEQHVDYLGVEARLASFMVDPKRLGLNTELRKSDRAMLCLNDEACTNKLDNEDSRFNATTQMCSLHETPNAGQDAQPVRFF